MKSIRLQVGIIIILITLPGLLSVLFYNFTFHQSQKIRTYVEREFFLSEWARSFNTFVNVSLLGHNQIGPVHLGIENWLFINYPHEESFKQFVGNINEKGLKSWLSYTHKNCPNPYDESIPYIFGLIPNKEYLYPEKTSYKWKQYFFKNEPVLNLVSESASKNCNKNFVDVFSFLKEEKLNLKNENLYHATDSHWNAFGAWKVFNLIMNKIGKHPHIIDFEKQNWPNGLDAWELIKPSAPFLKKYFAEKNAMEIMNKDKLDHCYKFTPFDNFHVYINERVIKPETVLLIGDSFRTEIAKYFACTYKTTIVIKRSAIKEYFNKVITQYGKPDVIVELFIQRYMDLAYL
jgi:hypothetical protein